MAKKAIIISVILLIVILGAIIIFNFESHSLGLSSSQSISGLGNGLGTQSKGVWGERSMEMAQDSASAGSAPNTITKNSSVPESAPQIEKKIIKTGALSIKVEKADKAAEAIANIAKNNKGEVYGSNFYKTTRGSVSGYITLKVPFDNFDKTFSDLKTVAAEVINQSTNTQDVTMEYIDLEARLKNKKAEEESFSALLQRSGKMEDILGVTRELARVRGEIEQLEGQKRYMDSQTDMSTITVDLTEDVEITPVDQDWRPWQTFKASVKQLIINSQSFVNGLIIFIIVVLPMLIIYGLIIWLLVYLGIKISKRIHNKKE